MKATAKRVRIVELFIDGESLGLFEVESQWKGFSQLVEYRTSVLDMSPKECIVFGLGAGLEEFFSDIFSTEFGRGVSLVKYCPKIARELSLKKNDCQPATPPEGAFTSLNGAGHQPVSNGNTTEPRDPPRKP